MALPALASIDDLEAYSGLTIDQDRAEAILSAASTLVRTYTARVWVGADGEWEEDVSELHQNAVSTVVLLVAERVYRNPAGQTQETTGPFSHSVAAWAAFGMQLTDDEKAMLPVSGQAGIPGLSSVRLIAPVLAAGVPRNVWDLDDDEDSQFEETGS